MLVLVVASVPWLGSVSHSVHVPVTLNARVAMGGDNPGSLGLPSGAILGQPGGPLFRVWGTGPQILQKKLPFRATELGVVWQGKGDPPDIRTSRDGLSWTAWSQVEDDVDMLEEASGTHYSSLLAGRKARFAQLRPKESSGARSFKIAVINTMDGPKKTVRLKRSASAATPKPDIVPRAAWGADESIRREAGPFIRAKSIFLHHTNTPNNDADPAGTIRAMYSYHVKTRGFHDICYKFLIDQRGRVYEGRHSRDLRNGEAPTGEDLNGSTVLGAHTKDHNAASIGIAMIGNSDTANPGERAMDSLVRLSAWEADRHGIDPLGKHLHVNPETGKTEIMPNIAGHKDSSSTITECPGAILHSQLPSLRKQVEEAIVSTSHGSPPSMPTGTTMAQSSPSSSMMPSATGDVSRSAVQVDLIFEPANGGPIRTVSVKPEGGSFKVTAESYGGDPLAQGVYAIRAVAFDDEGRTSIAAQVADGYELRRPPPIPRLEPILPPVDSPLGKGRSNVIAEALSTVIKALGL